MCRLYIITTAQVQLHPRDDVVCGSHITCSKIGCWCRDMIFTTTDIKAARCAYQLLHKHGFCFILANLKSKISYSVSDMPEYMYNTLETLTMLTDDVEVKVTHTGKMRKLLLHTDKEGRGERLSRNKFVGVGISDTRVDCVTTVHPVLRQLLSDWISSQYALIVLQHKLPLELCQVVATMCLDRCQ